MGILLKNPLLVGLCSVCMAFSAKGGLKEITKPEVGFYECKIATLSGKDLLGDFSYIRLQLKEDNTFILYYQKPKQEMQTQKGKYEYDREKEEICLSMGEKNTIKRKFPMRDGKITLHMRLGTKNLQVQFEQK